VIRSHRHQRKAMTPDELDYAERVRRNKKRASDGARTERETATRRAIKARNMLPIF
jgi:hypothetical protein